MVWMALLAQAATQPARQPSLMDSMPLFLGLGLIMWFLVLRPRSAEQKKYKDMMSSIKKGDRVITIAGIIGTVVNLTDDEVVLKIDESTNTKMTLVRNAIKANLSAGPQAPAAAAKT